MVRYCFGAIAHRLTHRNKVNWNDFSTLVQQLEVGVLGIATCTTKYYWRRILHWLAIAIDALAIAFHIELLQPFWKPIQGISVRNDCVRANAAGLLLMEQSKGHDYGQILLKRCILKMQVHRLGASQEFLKVLKTILQGNR